MDQSIIKSKIQEFFKLNNLCVISTIHTDGHGPESAVVAFSETEDLKIIIGTSNESRKYKNIQSNPNVSLVIGWNSELGTIQYEGVARELTPDESAEYSALQVAKNPTSAAYVNRPDQRYFLIQPKWIRLTDNRSGVSEIFEIDL